MVRAQGAFGEMEEILEALASAIGPSFTPEEAAITIQLSHDRGMRLRNIFRENCPANASEAYRKQLDTYPILYEGRHVHVLKVQGVRFEWPARTISHGDGRISYI